MDKREEIYQWYKIANDNLETAEFIFLNRHPSPDEIVCNLCQQSAEKFLKGLLVEHDVFPQKTHDLLLLMNELENLRSGFNSLAMKCTVLSRYGVIPRYPNEIQITQDDAKTAIQYAKDIRDYVNRVKQC
jgi:HEPN domain-containing protein